MKKALKLHKGHIRVGRPLPWDVYDSSDHLLLSCGYVIDKEAQLEALLERGMYVDAADLEAAARLRRQRQIAPAQQGNLVEQLHIFRRQQRRQMSDLLRTQTPRRAAEGRHALEDRRAPVLLPDANQLGDQRFHIVDRHQLTQQRLSLFTGLLRQ